MRIVFDPFPRQLGDASRNRFGLGRRHVWEDTQRSGCCVGSTDQATSAWVLAKQNCCSSGLCVWLVSLPPRWGGEALPRPVGQPDAQYSSVTCVHRNVSTLLEHRFPNERVGCFGNPVREAVPSRTNAP